MKKTNFRFFKNTPLIDFQNTIHFNSNSERDNFFLNGNHYPELNVRNQDFNFIRDRSSIVINVSYNEMQGVNYCTFKSDFESTRYYAYVINYEYLNDNAIRVNLLVDGIMTYTQGVTLQTLPNLDISRQHLSLANYNNRIFELKNNGDILKTHTKSYFKNDEILFDELIVLISSSVDLRGKFGTEDDSKMRTSKGKKFDKVTSPLNLYACDIDDFNKLMDELSDYPWIAQNIKSMSLIPRLFMDDNLRKISFSSGDSLSGVNYLHDVVGLKTNKKSLMDELKDVSYNINEAMKMFGLDPVQDKHLFRNEYTTSEVYNYSGGQLFIDNGQLNEDAGLSYYIDIITGHHNEMKLFVDRYRVARGFLQGSYVNDSLIFDQFDDVPMLIDTFGLSMAKNANQRALAESKLVTNKIGNIMNPGADVKDRFFDAASLATNFSPSNLFGKFSDEHDYYKQQQAEQADMALETPSITQQTNGNSFNIANDMFGIHFKYSKPTDSEMRKIKKYYKLFGFQTDDKGEKLNPINTMSICNYVQFSGSWTIAGADVSIVEMMKAQFQNGVRLWHNNGTSNPMSQNAINNKIVR